MIPQRSVGQLAEEIQRLQAQVSREQKRTEDLASENKELGRKNRNLTARLATASKRLEAAESARDDERKRADEAVANQAKAEAYAESLRGEAPKGTYLSTLTPKERAIRWGTPEGKKRLKAAVQDIADFVERHGYHPGERPWGYEPGDFAYTPRSNEEEA